MKNDVARRFWFRVFGVLLTREKDDYKMAIYFRNMLKNGSYGNITKILKELCGLSNLRKN